MGRIASAGGFTADIGHSGATYGSKDVFWPNVWTELDVGSVSNMEE
jgi:hypothetical protein